MSEIHVNEQARRNYAIEAYTMGEEQFLQLYCGGECVATVCAPEGPTVTQFNVYNLNGLDDDDNEDPNLLVKTFKIRSSTNDTWREAVRFAYAHALTKLMVVDVRYERDLEDLAA